ncbi:hypothetical protein SAMD00019534_063820 [Acytostelium subglobosum LB1]|uniref:hypothetical protein n=1 Tax=Acytostelium subglobosum LB1 TaxID=1410327 RepID=UPI000644F51E|nr:hypothetical protein SAMD00019534_063820 [Acytostelium subglobosum LB1]GAM23207.1 hypothetical protein SAMD00019534_063820 [Acytostelium subglobosum LB1]|eukprot:XP_012753656.1 hypothetical protein SAMD00019534_063820 [Acytostelium subglobosum LB1]
MDCPDTIQVGTTSVSNYNKSTPILVNPVPMQAGSVVICSEIDKEICKFVSVYPNPITSVGSIPNVVIKPTFCSKSNGSIQVTNPNLFTSMTLRANYQVMNPTSTGLWENLSFLSEVGSYLLDTTSDDCGVQRFFLKLPRSIPQVVVTPRDSNICPTDYYVQLSLSDQVNGTIKWLIGETQTNDTLVKVDQSGIVVSYYSNDGDRCSTRDPIKVEVPPSNFELTWKIDNTNECVDGTGIVTLSGHAQLVVMADYPYRTIPFLDATNTTFKADYNTKYNVQTSCSTDVYVIMPTHPLPLLIEKPYPTDQTSCWFDTGFTIPNYMDFTNISLFNSFNHNVYYAVDGVLDNVPRAEYYLNYTYISANGSACPSTSLGIKTPKYNYIYRQPKLTDISFTYTFDPAQVCGTSVGGILTYISPTNESNTLTNNYEPGPTFDRTYRKGQLCDLFVNTVVPVGTMPAPTIVVKNASCLYSSDGAFNITSSMDNSDIYVNGQKYSVQGRDPVTLSNLDAGVYNIVVKSQAYACAWTGQVTIANSMPDFVFKYQVTKYVETCIDPTGLAKVTIEDPGNYTRIKPALNGSELTLRGAGYVAFTYGSCNGQVSIPVVQPGLLTITARKLQPVTCSEGDGIFMLIGKQGDTGIHTYEINSESVILTNVKPGATNYTVSAGACQTTFTLNTQLEDPLINVETTSTGTIRVSSSNPDVALSVLLPDPNNSALSVMSDTDPFQMSVMASGTFRFKTLWSDQKCIKDLTVNVTLSTDPSPNYYVRVPDCGLDSFTFVLVNHAQFIGVTINDIELPTNGELPGLTNNGERINFRYISMVTGKAITLLLSVNVETSIQPVDFGKLENETCQGTTNAVLGGLSSSTVYQAIPKFGDHTGPNQPQSNNAITTMTSDNYYMFSSPVGRPFCFKMHSLKVSGGEPSLAVTPSSAICTATDLVPLNISFGLNTAISQFSANINGSAYNASTFPVGQYQIQVNITDPVCRRRLPSQLVNLQQQLMINPTANTTQCQRLAIGINIPGSYYITIVSDTNSSNTINTTLDIVNTPSSDLLIDLAEGGNYTMTILNTAKCQSIIGFSVEKCVPIPPGAGKKNLGWIAAVVIGAIILAMGIAFAIRKCRKPDQITEIVPERIELETVSIYSGGKISQLDKF